MSISVGDHNAFIYHDARLRSYETPAPFHPAEPYPEYRLGHAGCSGENRIYAAVRDYLRCFGSDRERYGAPDWNPLGHLVHPGQTVLVKPNWVKHINDLGHPVESVVTHPAILRPIIDYLLIALGGKGRIVLGDAPIQSCDFPILCESLGVLSLVEFYRQYAPIPIELADFRKERAVMSLQTVVGRESIAGDPNGYAAVQIGTKSALVPVDHRAPKFRVTNYDPSHMAEHHRPDCHEYLISGSVLKADLVFFVAKMKTHRKAGITAALKNSVGINGSKDWLPHHSRGAKESGGDEYLYRSMLKEGAVALEERLENSSGSLRKHGYKFAARVLHRLARYFAKDNYFEGSWYGNDTVWRMVVDLNRILLYADFSGVIRDVPQRRLYFMVDGIIAGEGEGPIGVTPKPCGLLVGGESAPVVDAVICALMGFDYRKIPLIRESFNLQDLPLVNSPASSIRVHSNSPEFDNLNLLSPRRHFRFVPTGGWQGHIELGDFFPAEYVPPKSVAKHLADDRTY